VDSHTKALEDSRLPKSLGPVVLSSRLSRSGHGGQFHDSRALRLISILPDAQVSGRASHEKGPLESTMPWQFRVAYHNDCRLNHACGDRRAVSRGNCELLRSLSDFRAVWAVHMREMICYGATG